MRGVKWAVAVVGVLAVAVAMLVQFGYDRTAEAQVQCSLIPDGVDCKLWRISGSADARPCWNVEITCAADIRAEARACGYLPEHTGNWVIIEPAMIRRWSECKEPRALRVYGLDVFPE